MDTRFMEEAIALARQAAALGEVPVGAVVVKKATGEIVGRGFNRRESERSPLAHAELSAIDEASRTLGGWRLIDCELYVTLEPCPMCSGAIINSRIENVIFGAYDKRFGACGSVITLFDLPFNHKPELIGGVMEQECAGLLSEFFKGLREKKKK
ncbi:MAG: tRNA adenosine(34) deaminase TadA [Ruminococcus sp.]|nr:tRNA adenosine(34) deaminase TadA [Ruminococcus sp.]